MRTILGMGLAVVMSASAGHAAEAKRETAGKLADGSAIEAVTLSNGHGVSARILSYGATLQSLVGPDRAGRRADVTLGCGFKSFTRPRIVVAARVAFDFDE